MYTRQMCTEQACTGADVNWRWVYTLGRCEMTCTGVRSALEAGVLGDRCALLQMCHGGTSRLETQVEWRGHTATRTPWLDHVHC